MSVAEITKDNFAQEVELAKLPVLADFWAPWCGYCRRLSPVIDKVAESMSEKLSVVKVNVDNQVELEDRFGVDTIPTLILFKNGNAGEKLVNPDSMAAISAWLSAQGVV